MAALPTVTAPAPAPDILDDHDYTSIRRFFNDTVEALRENTSIGTTPHFFLDWGQMVEQFNAGRPVLQPLHSRVTAWNPVHKDALTVKRLAMEFFALFDHPEKDSSDKAIAKALQAMFFVGHHDEMQKKRNRALQGEEEREKIRAYAAHPSAARPSAASGGPMAVAEAALPKVDNSLFTDIPSAEDFPFQVLISLIPETWKNPSANVVTLSQQSHPQLNQALLHPYTHPVLIEVQTACLDLKDFFVRVASAPHNLQLQDEFQLKALKLGLALENYNVAVEYQKRTHLTQQLREAHEKHRAEMFTTVVPEDEVGPLFDIQGMITEIWPQDTLYVTAIFSPDHQDFLRLETALAGPFKHPILQAIQQAGQTLIEILKLKDQNPGRDRIRAFNTNMKTIHELTSAETFNQLRFS